MGRPRRPPAPQTNAVTTRYTRPALDRWTGRYTVSWETRSGAHEIRVHTRLMDMEGHPPSLASVLRAPAILRTYLQARRHPILPDPVPFLVWDAIRFLEGLVRPGTRVLEVGSGNSTLWFLRQGCWVTSLEHSPEWARLVAEAASRSFEHERRGRLRQHVVEGDAAVSLVEGLPDASFDLALIDSMNAHTWRRDALRAALPKVAPGGWVALDNSDHPNNWAAVEDMGEAGRTRFTGFAPMCPTVTQTSLWRL